MYRGRTAPNFARTGAAAIGRVLHRQQLQRSPILDGKAQASPATTRCDYGPFGLFEAVIDIVNLSIANYGHSLTHKLHWKSDIALLQQIPEGAPTRLGISSSSFRALLLTPLYRVISGSLSRCNEYSIAFPTAFPSPSWHVLKPSVSLVVTKSNRIKPQTLELSRPPLLLRSCASKHSLSSDLRRELRPAATMPSLVFSDHLLSSENAKKLKPKELPSQGRRKSRGRRKSMRRSSLLR
ncbi:hypothetical protein BHM03_00022858 [Ensete ventricosum]|uniref:Uncharacterized protein n=1 Tax=Ensete ventricosum TaxID=4639 RepID=A0A445MGI7_ENSVE|nr:hypothetical protein BHM03_00022858 [Ensete ventricosum]